MNVQRERERARYAAMSAACASLIFKIMLFLCMIVQIVQKVIMFLCYMQGN
ncbi:hypothetical protein ACJX0J_029508, partial [Zea mays]